MDPGDSLSSGESGTELITDSFPLIPHSAGMNNSSSLPLRRCGKSGLQLPEISLGLWHNFGGVDDPAVARELLLYAFESGVLHYDLANNYGPPPGSAESFFGEMMEGDLRAHRDEIIVSTKAGYHMWDGPYGSGGSRKYLLSSLDQSLRRMKLDYVDIFYHHTPDADTPMEETASALSAAVHSGKALYVGVSSYSPDQTAEMASLLCESGVRCLIHQPSYNMFNRWIEDGLLTTLDQTGMGCVVFSPLAQGMLTGRYLQGIPEDSRAAKAHGFLKPEQINESQMKKIIALNDIAKTRGQSLAQMAALWVLRHPGVTSAIIGASRVGQLKENIEAVQAPPLTPEELIQIESVLSA